MMEPTCLDFFIAADNNYPNQTARCVRLRAGDQFTVSYQQGENFKPGQKYRDFDNFIVCRVIYTPKKWWQFWKRRKVIGYTVMCIKD